jgi:O-antigen/teichoic acid export membrane protein
MAGPASAVVNDQGAVAAPPAAPGDLTGRDRMTWNVLVSWAGHVVFIAAGFVLPRFIDDHIGHAALGVWDFGWSLVSYFALAQVGLGSSVNRYVARHRAEGDTAALNGTVSSVMCIQQVAAALVLALTWAGVTFTPSLLHSADATLVAEARVVVLCLGVALAIQMAFDALRGVITGCHRWDLHNTINAGFHGATVAAMLAALAVGGGLRSLAVAHLVGTVGAETARAIVAFRACPELRLSPRLFAWRRARSVLTFGSKTVLAVLSVLLAYQTTSILIASHLGLAALALYARPVALVRHVSAIVGKLAFVLAPTASSMHAAGRPRDVQELLLNATRYAVAIALPPIIGLVVLGDAVLSVWMGPRYADWPLVAMLALGHLTAIGHAPVYSVLTALSRHGWPAIMALGGALATAGLVALALGPLDAGLFGAALGVVIPSTLVGGILLPIYACRVLRLPLGRFLAHAWGRPLLCAVPFTACLVAARFAFAGRPGVAVLAGSASGAALLVAIYWRWLLPGSARQRVRQRLARVLGRLRR